MVRKTLRRNYISIFVIALIVGIYLAVPGKEAIAWAEDSSIYNISGHMYESNNVYWFKGGDVATINAGDGYQISIIEDGAYGNEISLSEADIYSDNKGTIYYKNDNDSNDKVSIDLTNSIKWDNTVPTGQITINDTYNSTQLNANVSFDTVIADVTFRIENVMDVGSGVKDICYYISDRAIPNTENNTSQLITNLNAISASNWQSYTTGDNISLPTGQNVVYVKIVDNVGNVSYISSDGIVSYNTSSWGQDHTRDDGVVQYTDANGKSSISISSSNAKLNNNILWLYEESNGRDTWYGLELADVENIVDKDYRLYIQWLSPSDSGYHELYSKLDEDVRSKIQNNKNMIFRIGIEDSTGVRYVPVGIVNVYVMMEQDWNISDMRGCFIYTGADEFVSVRVSENVEYPEGKANFAVMKMRHFSPYILYDYYTDEEKAASEGAFGGSGTAQPSGDNGEDNGAEGTDGDAGSEKGTGIDTSTDGVSDDELGRKIDNSNADNNKGNNIERINNPDTSDDLGLHRWYAIMILSGLACWVMGKFYQRVENVGKFGREK